MSNDRYFVKPYVFPRNPSLHGFAVHDSRNGCAIVLKKLDAVSNENAKRRANTACARLNAATKQK